MPRNGFPYRAKYPLAINQPLHSDGFTLPLLSYFDCRTLMPIVVLFAVSVSFQTFHWFFTHEKGSNPLRRKHISTEITVLLMAHLNQMGQLLFVKWYNQLYPMYSGKIYETHFVLFWGPNRSHRTTWQRLVPIFAFMISFFLAKQKYSSVNVILLI